MCNCQLEINKNFNNNNTNILDLNTNDVICTICGMILYNEIKNEQDWRYFEHEKKSHADHEYKIFKNKKLSTKEMNVKLINFFNYLKVPNYLEKRIKSLISNVLNNKIKLNLKKIDYIIVSCILIEFLYNDLTFNILNLKKNNIKINFCLLIKTTRLIVNFFFKNYPTYNDLIEKINIYRNNGIININDLIYYKIHKLKNETNMNFSNAKFKEEFMKFYSEENHKTFTENENFLICFYKTICYFNKDYLNEEKINNNLYLKSLYNKIKKFIN